MLNSLYLHIPFCLSKCPYCSFSSFQGKEHLHDRYCRALINDIKNHFPEYHSMPLDTLFLGGGTPTVLPAEGLGEIIDVCRDVYGFSADAEISVEANPGTVDLLTLQKLRQKGVNRLSVGVQSFDNNELQALGRIYRSEEIFQVIEEAREAGFKNISLDLMYGLPEQVAGRWEKNLAAALALAPEHLSLYQLTIEENTPFFERYNQGMLSLPGEDIILEMDEITDHYCTSAGFMHYEISNFCRPGRECRHNLVYWRNDPYMACGAGAVSYCCGIRSRIVSDPMEYCLLVENNKDTILENEELSLEASFRETVMMGLRLTQGVEERRLSERFGRDFSDIYGRLLLDLANRGLVEVDSGYLRLTMNGRRLANVVMAELI